MRLCVIGNSHAAGLKRAWDGLAAQFPAVELIFFVAPGKRIADLALQGSRLIPATDDLRERLILSSGGRSDVVLADYHGFLLYGLFGLPQIDRRLSSQLREIILIRAANRIAALPLARILRGNARLFLGLAPIPAPEDPASVLQNLPHAALLDEITRRLPRPGPRLLAQPVETLCNGNTTDPAYLHGPGDQGHMNLDYNSCYLRQHLPALTA